MRHLWVALIVAPSIVQGQIPVASGQTVALRAMARDTARETAPRTEFVADGAVANSLSTDKGATPVTGALGIRHFAQREVFVALITVASTVDTLVSDDPITFARALLNPGASGKGNAASGLLDYQRFHDYGQRSQRSGLHVYASFSRYVWRFDSAGTSTTSDLTLLTGGLRAAWIAIRQVPDDRGNSFSFTGELGWTIRGLAGDVTRDETFRQRTLGTTARVFHGPELAFSIQLRQVTASATVPILGVFGGPKLDGLTGVQPVVGFSINAPVFTF